MNKKESLFMLSAMMAMTATQDNPYFVGHRRIEKPYPRPKDEPAWKVGKHTIFAKDEKTAIKYAKKRGLWKDGCKVEPIDKKI